MIVQQTQTEINGISCNSISHTQNLWVLYYEGETCVRDTAENNPVPPHAVVTSKYDMIGFNTYQEMEKHKKEGL